MTPGLADLSEQEATAFRDRVRAWLRDHVPPRDAADDSDRPPVQEDDSPAMVQRIVAYHSALHDAGLAGLTWPAKYGGAGLTLQHQDIFDAEASRFEVPRRLLTIGLGMCGPTILGHGTEAQKRRYLAPLLRGEEIWCQLFSEPNAGSDLAGVETRAVPDGSGWVLRGQKVWSSVAHHASFGLCLARTDPDVPKHEGLTMFIVDMHAPGITVRPLRQMNGATNFNEVYLDGVPLPADAVVGGVGRGWATAITTLMNERTAVGGGPRPASVARRLIDVARARGTATHPLTRQRLAELYTRETIQGFVRMRIAAATEQHRAPGPEGSISKLAVGQINRLAAAVANEILGAAGTAHVAGDEERRSWMELTLASPSLAIAGGTDEIQRNIIGERVLGLPREPQVDRDVPFRDLLRSAPRDRRGEPET